ncbi:MAG: nucleoside deaminase [Alphaproteobacteria bacterium]
MSNQTEQDFMEQAAKLSLERMRANFGGPFGAVIVKDGVVIAHGYNKVTSTCDPTAHAEITAIREAAAALGNFDLSGCVIYSSCEPCPMCLAAIYWARIDRIYYAQSQQDAAAIGFDDAFLYEQLSLPAKSRSIGMIKLDNETAAQAMQEWALKTDKISY